MPRLNAIFLDRLGVFVSWCLLPVASPRRWAAALAIAAAGCAVAPGPPPNVVLIVADDQAWTDFGFMGHPVVRTPRLDRLATESAVFPNGSVPTSLCRASLATLLTGLYAHQHRICCNDPPEGIDRSAMLPFLRDAPTVPRLLQRAGYRSFQTGKFWEGHYANGGFTDGMTTEGRHGGPGLAIGRETMQPIYDFIAARGKAPFFLWYAPMMPHDPHTPPERILRTYAVDGRPIRQARYYAMCEWFDETCGALLDHLDAMRLAERTLVLFVVDNGWILRGPEEPPSRYPFSARSKSSPYDGGVRTPVMLRWPGRVRPGRYPDLVSTIDVAPTILAACGLRPTSRMPGRSLLGAAAGGGPVGRAAVFGEIFTHTAVDLRDPALSLTHRWVREGDWKLIVPAERDGAAELYDVGADPHEERNRAAEAPDRVVRLRGLLDDWWTGRKE